MISFPEIKAQVETLKIAERFFDSAVLFALFELGVMRALADGPRPLDELQKQVKGDEESLRALLDAAVALKVLAKKDGEYQAPEVLIKCLGREDSPAYLGEWVAFLQALAGPMLQFSDVVRSAHRPGALFEDMSSDSLPAKRMTQAMDAYARTRGVELAEQVDFTSTKTLLDLGCGPGTYSLAIIERCPGVEATLLDLPGPIAEARRIITARGMMHRVELVSADAMKFDPGRSFDTVLVSNTLHMLGPAGSIDLLKRCYEMTSPGGRIIVQAQYLDGDRTYPRWPTLLNLIQRVATPHGRNHSIDETTNWLKAVGFVEIEYRRFSLWNVNSALIGTRPA